MNRSVVQGLATAGQYIVPLVCVIAAAIFALGRAKRQKLVEAVADSPAVSVLDGMSWRDFERLVGEGFRLQGYRVEETGDETSGGTGGGRPDGGVDLVLRRDREVYLVQCKQWRAFKVGVEVVRELYGVMAARGAAGGFVVTSGTFTAEAKALAEGRNVRLVDGQKLFGMIRQARAALAETKARPAAEPEIAVPGVQRRATTPFGQGAGSRPACPACGKAMVSRVAKKGQNAGKAFWGCVGYPACKGTRAAAG